MNERKTEQAKELLVRYIRDQKLEKGDKLPSQDFFRQQFKFGTTTVAAAIRELRDDGVLEVRDKVGVFVTDPIADGHTARVIGITAVSRDISAYYGSLLCLLQMKLAQYGCRAEIFCSSRIRVRSCSPIEDFPGLRRSIERGELDGLMSLDNFGDDSYEYFRAKRLPAVFVGSICDCRNAVFIDDPFILRCGIARMRELGAQRIAIVLSNSLQFSGRDLIRELLEETHLPANSLYTGCSAADGARIAERFLAMSPGKRPDAWVALDDVVAGALASTLALRLPPQELPAAAILSNLNTGFSFPVPRLFLYENHLDRFAAMAVELLIRNFTEELTEAPQLWYKPEERKIFAD